jgi:hypothetical protein
MSRGNQREVDRARAQKRAAAAQKKGKKKEGDGNAAQALTTKKETSDLAEFACLLHSLDFICALWLTDAVVHFVRLVLPRLNNCSSNDRPDVSTLATLK